MTEMQDPEEILRESLAKILPPHEEHPPVIRRAEVWPYPELDRLWVRVETSPFAAFPDLAFRLIGPDGNTVSSMFQVEIRTAYQSLTMHLRQAPQPGQPYQLEIELSRAEQVLDTRVLPFDLVYTEPGGKA